MDPITIMATINTVLTVANAAIKLGQDASPHLQAMFDTFSGKTVAEITDADLNKLEAAVDAAHADIQKPLPPE